MPPSTEDQPTLINEISTLEMSKQAFSREYFAHRSNRYELHETSHDVVVSGSDSGYRLIFADKTFAKHHKNHDSSSEYLCALYICDSVFCGAHVKDDEVHNVILFRV